MKTVTILHLGLTALVPAALAQKLPGTLCDEVARPCHSPLVCDFTGGFRDPRRGKIGTCKFPPSLATTTSRKPAQRPTQSSATTLRPTSEPQARPPQGSTIGALCGVGVQCQPPLVCKFTDALHDVRLKQDKTGTCQLPPSLDTTIRTKPAQPATPSPASPPRQTPVGGIPPPRTTSGTPCDLFTRQCKPPLVCRFADPVCELGGKFGSVRLTPCVGTCQHPPRQARALRTRERLADILTRTPLPPPKQKTVPAVGKLPQRTTSPARPPQQTTSPGAKPPQQTTSPAAGQSQRTTQSAVRPSFTLAPVRLTRKVPIIKGTVIRRMPPQPTTPPPANSPQGGTPPAAKLPPKYPPCGGFRPTPLECPKGTICVDDPRRGGCGMACDMPGICVAPRIFCGGIAAIQCPTGMICIDNPNDGCDPQNGGRDCGGICV